MAIVFPRNALIRLTGLNTWSQRNLQEITAYSAAGGVLTLYTSSTSGIVNGSTVYISNVNGLANGSRTVSNVTATSFDISATLSWNIKSVRSYKAEYYVDDIVLDSYCTMGPGDVTSNNLPAGYITGTQTIVNAAPTGLYLNSANNPGGTYPIVGYNATTPGGTISLTATAAGRAASATRAYWSVALGSSTQVLSDHNRKPVSVDFEPIETGERMADGTLRKSHIASKRTFSTSWEWLPADGNTTVDGYAGGRDLYNIYMCNTGNFTLELYNRDSATKVNGTFGVPETSVTVRISDFNYDIAKRNVNRVGGGLTDLWDVSMSWEEI